MSKHKRARSTKARPKAVRRPLARRHIQRTSSKQARVLALLSRSGGATIACVMRSTGWQPHTVRAFLAAVVRKKLGLNLESEKKDGARIYRIVAGRGSVDPVLQPSA